MMVKYDLVHQIGCAGLKVLALADLHFDHYLSQRICSFKNVPNALFMNVTYCVLAVNISDKGHNK